jgi:flavin reductase (DIM6/NTAB) family NADH-FMN oxidoreductase RutF
VDVSEPHAPAGEPAGDSTPVSEFVAQLDRTMLLVTTRHGPALAGCLVGFSTQTSMDPFRYLVCLSRANATTRVAEEATHLALHQIGPDQLDLVRLFGEHTQDDVDKFAHCHWTPGPFGLPLLTGCPAWLVGAILSRIDAGDHVAVLLAPVAAARTRPSDAVRFSELPPLSPGHPA